MTSQKGLHHWTKNDDVVAYYLYRFGADELDLSLEEIAEKLDMSARSMRMRIQNFQALDGKGGLSNAARLSKNVYAGYKMLLAKIPGLASFLLFIYLEIICSLTLRYVLTQQVKVC